MEYEVVPDKLDPTKETWRVEAIDFESEGECYVAIFGGPRAQERAAEYADWKSRQLKETSTSISSTHV